LHPQDLVDQAIAIGLEGFTITDHHTVKGYQIAQDYLRVLSTGEPVSTPLPQLWIGIEITAQLLGTEVHILGYAFDINHPAMQIYSQGREPTGETALAANVIAALHQAGGLAVLAHPARYRRSPQDLIPVAATLGIDGVETYYAYGNPNPWHPSPKQTQQVKQLSQTYALLNTCGTDTHGSSLLQRL
jgi:predicted metal-dependent phosphoesterase TrpH